MSNEISDKVEMNGKAVLKQGAPCGSMVHYDGGCHAEIETRWKIGGEMETQLGILAAQAGYKAGEEFEYSIIIKKKE
jgi:hypothetical protein